MSLKSTGLGAGEGSRRMEIGADPGAGGSALSEELRQQIFQFVTENLPMLEDIIRQAKEGGRSRWRTDLQGEGERKGTTSRPLGG